MHYKAAKYILNERENRFRLIINYMDPGQQFSKFHYQTNGLIQLKSHNHKCNLLLT